MAAPFNPLGPQHQQLVTQGCQQCEEFRAYLDQLDKVGVPTEQYREQLAGFEHLFQTVRDLWLTTQG